MEIGIISDTHLSAQAQYTKLYSRIQQAFADVELILHAGDVTNIKFVTELERIAPVEAVLGNMDDSSMHERFTGYCKLEIAGKKIGMLHEIPSFSFIKQEQLDIVVSGHTHSPSIKEYYELEHGFLHLNPGSPVQPRAPPINKRYQIQRPALPTVMILNLDEELSSAYIITLK